MGFSVGALRGGVERRGIVDHRLARRMLINQVRCGRIALEQVCDAHPELIRAARNVGTQTSTRCPICEQSDVFMASYKAKDASSSGSSVSLTPFLVTPCPSAK